MRHLLVGGLMLAAFAAPAGASPPLDLFEESGVRLAFPDADFAGADVGLGGVGDVNGDGLGDIAIGNPTEQGTASGAIHVLLGRPSLRAAPRLVIPDDGFTISGPRPKSDQLIESGRAVTAAGDVNGDGFGDILIASLFATDEEELSEGLAHVVFGSAAPGDVRLDQLGKAGFSVSNTGGPDYRVAGLGDLDRDGFDEIAVSANFDDIAVVYGSSSPQPLDALELGDRGFRIVTGDDYYSFGSVASAGDVNGDLHPDLVAGLPGSILPVPRQRRPREGGVVIFGGPRRTQPINASALGAHGFLMEIGPDAPDPGSSVTGLGDFNGDGFDDVALLSDGPGLPAVYVVLGSKSTEKVQLEELGTRGLRLLVGRVSHGTGGVVGAGDVNGDGRPDALIGYVRDPFFRQEETDTPGRAWVVFGGPFATDVRLRGLRGPGDNPRGFMMRGLPRDSTGFRVAAPGDMDGDGHVELAVLALECRGREKETTNPEVYLPDFLSRSRGLGLSSQARDELQTNADTPRLRGRGGSDELMGDAATNCLYGDDGEDRLDGVGGEDVLFGGPDNDRVDGGPGGDFLHGGPGADNLTGEDASDDLYGGAGDDALVAGTGDDILVGAPGADTLKAGGGDDRLFGGSGNDVLSGGEGSDYLSGGRGDDEIDAVDGERDTVYCGSGQDRVEADPEDEVDECDRVTRKQA